MFYKNLGIASRIFHLFMPMKNYLVDIEVVHIKCTSMYKSTWKRFGQVDNTHISKYGSTEIFLVLVLRQWNYKSNSYIIVDAYYVKKDKSKKSQNYIFYRFILPYLFYFLQQFVIYLLISHKKTHYFTHTHSPPSVSYTFS